MNSKTLSSTKKYSVIKLKEFKPQSISLEHIKSTKYRYHVLMIKDLFQRMTFIRGLVFIKTYILTKKNKKEFSQK